MDPVVDPEDFTLDPACYDVLWDKHTDPEALGGLKLSPDKGGKWIVQLRFEQQHINRCGTGFFVNIPDSQQHVILTAGHNLIDSRGNHSEKLKIHLPPGIATSIASKDGVLTIEPNQRYISASYEKDRRKTNEKSDYGAILLPKREGEGASGFGFALKLGHDNLAGKKLKIAGYVQNPTLGEPLISDGDCIRDLNKKSSQLFYDFQTQQGLSGSPVFISYKGSGTAIAIHTNGGNDPEDPSRGTRLNETLLGDVFRWAGVGRMNQSLMALDLNKKPMDSLFLRFPPRRDCAWVRKGMADLRTAFDILPAYAPTASIPEAPGPQYVFRFKFPPGWKGSKKEKWVVWDVMKQEVTRTKTLKEICLVQFKHVPRGKYEKGFWITSRVPKGTLPGEERNTASLVNSQADDIAELRVQATKITEQDMAMGEFDTPEVSFGKHGGKKNAPQPLFNIFSFQDGG